MNFQFYFEKLIVSDTFKKFLKENKGAFLCSSFFVIDKKGKENKQSIDYFVPSIDKMFSFKMDNGIELIPIEDYGKGFKPEKIPDNVEFNFEDIEEMIQGRMNEEKIKNKIEKLLFSLQARDKTNYLLGTVFISGLGILQVKIDLNERKVVNFEKKSFFDMMKVVKKGDKI
jgi:hypothetical protein